jgi:hypothetical protein
MTVIQERAQIKSVQRKGFFLHVYFSYKGTVQENTKTDIATYALKLQRSWSKTN